MTRRLRRFLLFINLFTLLVALTLCLPSGADAFLGGFFSRGKDKSREKPKEKQKAPEQRPSGPFTPVTVPGMAGKTGDAPPVAPVLSPEDADGGVLFLDTAPTGPDTAPLKVVPLFPESENSVPEEAESATGQDGTDAGAEPKGSGATVGAAEPVLFYDPVPVEDIDEAPVDFVLEDLIFGASTDEALLRLARIFVAKGEVKKGTKTYSRLIEDFPASASRFNAFYELGYLRYRDNRLTEARMLLKYVVKSRSAAVTLKDSARELLEEIDSIYERGAGPSGLISIGALLPLDGKYAKMGNAALRGILLATGAFETAGQPVDVYVRDTGATPRGAKAAIEELVGVKKVRALVGPMLSSTATEAARYAQNKQTPIVALSQRDGLTGVGNFVFRNSLLPARQASLVASYSYHTLGNRTYVILYPRSRYGATLARAFAKEVTRLGGVVINKASYRPGSKDLNRELKDLFLIEEEETIKGRRTIKEYNPTVVADALYMPDYYRTVSMVVPYLKYFNINDLQLLGSNGWNSPKLLKAGGRNVRGAIFADGFFIGSGRAATVDFIGKYEATYGTKPGVVESQAYDAVKLLLEAMSRQDYKWMDHNTLRLDLNGVSGVIGSTGEISVEKGGEVDKKLFLLKVERSGIVEVEVDEAVRIDSRGESVATGSEEGYGGGGDKEEAQDELWN